MALTEKERYILFSVIGFVAILSIIIRILGLSGLSAVFEPSDPLRFLDVVVSSLLTGLLVVLYFQQYTVQKDQTELKRAELSGELYVNDYSYDEESIEVTLSNLSGSEITQLTLRTEIFPKEINGMELGVSSKPLQRTDEHETQFGRLVGLAPREQGVEFSATPAVYYTKEDGKAMLPEVTFFITELRKGGVKEIQCRMWVEGKDQLDQTVKSKVFRWDKTVRIDIEKNVADEPSLEEVFQHSISGSTDENLSDY